MIGTTSMDAGERVNAVFQVNVAVACPCAGIKGTMVFDAAMMSLFSLRTKTTTCTLVRTVTLGFVRVASTRGSSEVPPCVMLDKQLVGAVESNVVWNIFRRRM